MKGSAQDSYRKFGSIRILRDGRVRFNPWTFPGLCSFCFVTKGDSIEVERGARVVLYLWAPRKHVASACFAYDLPHDKLRALVSELRRAGHGLERWIVPGLEFSQISTNWKNNPDTYAIIPELLESCRDLPVAEQWTKVRANVFANAEKARANASGAPPARAARKATIPRPPSPRKEGRPSTPGRASKAGNKARNPRTD